MTQDEMIEDFKQFIAATVRQATADMATKADIADMATKADIAGLATKADIAATKTDLEALRAETRQGFQAVDARFDEVMSAIADTMAARNDDVDEQLVAHEQRITALEAHSQAA